MNSDDIIAKARAFTNPVYVYWYGGKNNICSINLLNELKKLYPSVYKPSYVAACKLDIQQHKRCIDCSGLVCASYNKPMVGTSQFDKYFTVYKGSPVDGMIVWRKNHCGIYYNGKIIEARGRWAGITATRPYVKSYWSKIYYDANVTYISLKSGSKVNNYNKVVKDVIAGKYGNGQERKDKLTKAGYDPDIIQKLVNNALAAQK